MRIGATTAREIINETYIAIWENYPNVCVSVDGKHIRIQQPYHGGSAYYNYENYNSIVLQAVVDAEGNFLFVDVGEAGRYSDGGVFAVSNSGKNFIEQTLNLPQPRKIDPAKEIEFPYIQSESGLREAYMDSNDELGKWLKQVFALPFLACHEVNEAFTVLISICPNNSVGYLFSDYILKNYIEDECLFPPELWTEKPSMNPRTTNGPESFHHTYNGQFYHPHPHIYLVIKVLMEFQSATETNIRSIALYNDRKILKEKEKECMEFTINAYNNHSGSLWLDACPARSFVISSRSCQCALPLLFAQIVRVRTYYIGVSPFKDNTVVLLSPFRYRLLT
ncbi:hypothetical protein QTP88_010414 [Uroleucon formosanum]